MNSNNKRRVVITGLGTVNPTGSTVKESWAAVKAGRCAVGPITAFDTADFKVKLAAEVKDFDPNTRLDRREARKMARFTQFAVAAAIEAIQDSGLVLENIDRTRFGVILSSGIGGLPTIEAEHTRSGLPPGRQPSCSVCRASAAAPRPPVPAAQTLSAMPSTVSGTAMRTVCSAAAQKAASARWVSAALPA